MTCANWNLLQCHPVHSVDENTVDSTIRAGGCSYKVHLSYEDSVLDRKSILWGHSLHTSLCGSPTRYLVAEFVHPRTRSITTAHEMNIMGPLNVHTRIGLPRTLFHNRCFFLEKVRFRQWYSNVMELGHNTVLSGTVQMRPSRICFVPWVYLCAAGKLSIK